MKNNRTNGGRQRFEQEAPNPSVSSDPYVTLEYPASGRHKVGQGPYLCRSQVMLMTTYKSPASDAFYEKDGRNSRYIGEVLGGIEEKMPKISREVNQMILLRIGQVSTLSGGKFGKSIR